MHTTLASAPRHGTEPWALGPRVPQTQSRRLRRFAWWCMRTAGWRFEGTMPDLPKFVVIVAPHTSNWDFIIGLFAKWSLGLDVRWLGKDTLFLPPLGWFMRAIGGVPVDRSARNNMVDQAVQEFATRERFVFVLAPEGTRRRVPTWRSGFWHAARRAGVPVCVVALDWGRRVVRLGPTTDAVEEDAEAGIRRVRTYYHGVTGRDPSLQG